MESRDEYGQTVDENEESTKLRFITPVLEDKWGGRHDIHMEYPITNGVISIDEYNEPHRGKPKKADYLLCFNENVPLAVVEAKGSAHSADEGYNQAKEYARRLDVPFAYATNGDDLIELDLITGINKNLKMMQFPTKEALWNRYCHEMGLDDEMVELYTEPYYTTLNGKRPRYYQRIAINRTIEHIEKGKKRLLLVMATGTGKTFCSFQIIYRFWHTHTFKKILYLADRNILIDQTMRKDFYPFLHAMEKIDNKNIHTSKDIFLGLYQQLVGNDNGVEKDYYKQLPRDFFDLIIIDECHRGSANDDSNWHKILTYFASAVQVGMTATPKDGGLEDAESAIREAETNLAFAKRQHLAVDVRKYTKALTRAKERYARAMEQSNLVYFGKPIYTYSLKQGIEDGFLAPYRVVNVELNIDKNGWTPAKNTTDVDGDPVPIRTYTQDDFDRIIVLPDRRKAVAKRITDFMKTNDMRYAKTIVFCEDIPHCQEMVRLLENENADLVAEDTRYIMQITGDNEYGKAQLDNFIDPSSKYPVIAVTSRLMSTGVDAETCKIIVLDRKIGSMTEFKQIIGRGTRIKEKYVCDGEEDSKMFFTILDFRKNYTKFNDPDFDGSPADVTTVPEDNKFPKPPVRPSRPQGNLREHPQGKVIRINGVDVEIVNEDVFYRDENGNLVEKSLNSEIRNNIVMQYPKYEDFKKAWLGNNNKAKFASDLLLEIEWGDRFYTQYGYEVDVFDIIAYFGYDIEPPMSKRKRTEQPSVQHFLAAYPLNIQQIARGLLDTYIASDFVALRDVKNVFSMNTFDKMGLTPLSAMRIFSGKTNYIKFLHGLEQSLYE